MGWGVNLEQEYIMEPTAGRGKVAPLTLVVKSFSCVIIIILWPEVQIHCCLPTTSHLSKEPRVSLAVLAGNLELSFITSHARPWHSCARHSDEAELFVECGASARAELVPPLPAEKLTHGSC